MSDDALKGEVEVVNPQGLHLRPMTRIMETVKGFDAEVHLRRGDQVANCKLITEMMMLIAPQGACFEVTATGPGAADAVAALSALFAGGFGE